MTQDAMIDNLARLAKWCQAKDPNATIWLHAIEAADALSAYERLREALEGGTISQTSFDGHCVRIDFETREEADALMSALSQGDDCVETGWLIEEQTAGYIHWVALAKGKWPHTTRSTHPFVSDRYQTPIHRVKDANLALRFARKADAEAFMELFDRFLLEPYATEHSWSTASPLPQGED